MNFQHFRIKCDFNAISSEKTATSGNRRISGKNTKNISNFPLWHILHYHLLYGHSLIDCNVICDYIRPITFLEAACGKRCDIWHDWVNCHEENGFRADAYVYYYVYILIFSCTNLLKVECGSYMDYRRIF